MEEIVKFVFVLILGLLSILVQALLNGLLVMFFWNWILVSKFGFPPITYVEGWGICTLTSLLFKSSSSKS